MAHRFPFATFAALLAPGPQRDLFAGFAHAKPAIALRHVERETARVSDGHSPRAMPARRLQAAARAD